MKKGQAPARILPDEAKAVTPPVIELRLDQGYIIARCGDVVQVFELIWQSHHGDTHKQLVLRECVPIPRQFEREAFGERS